MAPAYLTYNLNCDNDLANGSKLRLHSLSFDTKDEEMLLRQIQQSTPYGNTIDLPTPPKAINVELYLNYDEDSMESRANHKQKQQQ